MSMRRQEKDADKFESECSYCGAGVKENAMRCPSCKKMFSSGKKAIVVSVVAIVVMASMGAFFYNYLATAGVRKFRTAAEAATVAAEAATQARSTWSSRRTSAR
jgi:hypothetical protein